MNEPSQADKMSSRRSAVVDSMKGFGALSDRARSSTDVFSMFDAAGKVVSSVAVDGAYRVSVSQT